MSHYGYKILNEFGQFQILNDQTLDKALDIELSNSDHFDSESLEKMAPQARMMAGAVGLFSATMSNANNSSRYTYLIEQIRKRLSSGDYGEFLFMVNYEVYAPDHRFAYLKGIHRISTPTPVLEARRILNCYGMGKGKCGVAYPTPRAGYYYNTLYIIAIRTI